MIFTETKLAMVAAAIAFLIGSSVSGGAAWYVQGLRLDKEVADHNTFVAQTNAVGKVAQAEVKVITDKQIKIKEVADVDYKTLSTRLAADNKRLRDDRASRSFTPAPSADTGRTDIVCFDRAELEQAFRFLNAGVSDLTEEGDANTLKLLIGMRWAQSLQIR